LIKFEDDKIERLQTELKYLKSIKTKQEKEVGICENDQVKRSVVELEDEIVRLK
jgi:hypothetical protein